MAYFIMLLSLLFALAPANAAPATFVIWSKAIARGYALYNSNPGPDIPFYDNLYYGRSASGTYSAQLDADAAGFSIGNGPNGTEGNCSFYWTSDLANYYYQFRDSVFEARLRGEYRNGVYGTAMCAAGSISIRCGVADFSRNITAWGGAGNVPDNAMWRDTVNPLRYDMGFNASGGALQAQEIKTVTIPGAALDGNFFEIDITTQLRYITHQNGGGQYAIVFLTGTQQGASGKVTLYAAEECALPTPGSATHWTTDGNTVHLLGLNNMAATIDEKPSAALLKDALSISPAIFNSSAHISFTLSRSAHVVLGIYGPDGKLVKRLLDSQYHSGSHAAGWNGTDMQGRVLPSGCYIVRLAIPGKELVRKSFLVR